jgi:hypothetical protein
MGFEATKAQNFLDNHGYPHFDLKHIVTAIENDNHVNELRML